MNTPLKWTSERPATEGYYWFWQAGMDEPQLGIVAYRAAKPIWFTCGDEEWCEAKDMVGQFAFQKVPAVPV